MSISHVHCERRCVPRVLLWRKLCDSPQLGPADSADTPAHGNFQNFLKKEIKISKKNSFIFKSLLVCETASGLRFRNFCWSLKNGIQNLSYVNMCCVLVRGARWSARQGGRDWTGGCRVRTLARAVTPVQGAVQYIFLFDKFIPDFNRSNNTNVCVRMWCSCLQFWYNLMPTRKCRIKSL